MYEFGTCYGASGETYAFGVSYNISGPVALCAIKPQGKENALVLEQLFLCCGCAWGLKGQDVLYVGAVL
jgi:hypothetical protein